MVADNRRLTQEFFDSLADRVAREYHDMRVKRKPINMKVIQLRAFKNAGISDPSREMLQELGRILGKRAAARRAAQKRNGLPPRRPQAIRVDRAKKPERFPETLWPM